MKYLEDVTFNYMAYKFSSTETRILIGLYKNGTTLEELEDALTALQKIGYIDIQVKYTPKATKPTTIYSLTFKGKKWTKYQLERN